MSVRAQLLGKPYWNLLPFPGMAIPGGVLCLSLCIDPSPGTELAPCPSTWLFCLFIFSHSCFKCILSPSSHDILMVLPCPFLRYVNWGSARDETLLRASQLQKTVGIWSQVQSTLTALGTVSDLFSWLAFPFGLWMVSHARELKVFYGSLQNDWIALFQSWLREKIFAVLPSDFYFFFLIFYCSSIKPWRRIWRTVYYIHFCVPRAHNPLGSIKLGAAQWQMSSVMSQSSHCLLPSPP